LLHCNHIDIYYNRDKYLKIIDQLCVCVYVECG